MSYPILPGSLAARSLRGKLQDRVTSKELELPLLPETSGQVLTACQDGSCDAREIADLIQSDPSLAGHVLRVANSAAYAPTEPIVSLQQAVSRLGFGAVSGIAVAVIAQGEMFEVAGHEERLRRLWRHSATAAAWGQEVARLQRKNVEGAFLCGLLHDMGKPIVLQALSAIVELTGLELSEDIWDAWLYEFHEDVGGRLLAGWGMPEWILEPIRHHHAPEGAEHHLDGARTLYLADRLAHVTVGGEGQRSDELRRDPVLESLGIYIDELEELLEQRESVTSMADAYLI